MSALCVFVVRAGSFCVDLYNSVYGCFVVICILSRLCSSLCMLAVISSILCAVRVDVCAIFACRSFVFVFVCLIIVGYVRAVLMCEFCAIVVHSCACARCVVRACVVFWSDSSISCVSHASSCLCYVAHGSVFVVMVCALCAIGVD